MIYFIIPGLLFLMGAFLSLLENGNHMGYIYGHMAIVGSVILSILSFIIYLTSDYIHF